ncbi:phosphatidate cytidylyltransferase [Desulfatibacillum alkenivorans DSM 16219]|jgi:phosphatidate cytidylyltransferase|uniref:Phosphatidate cytidylyltransferase n=1 Tax=Desulfatibacillum alkenivorans DSM 16219 TaxID=1121393 RepID=A0A1M6DYA0_9BACT|nr:phosphatidate cytidylyltransferase [Desulfatibacillum alkenivorans]SHI78129.1 phosphatidate cytidylyltransferase [Desulfatibacillum alkenivorans DSM 16219]
MAYSSHAKRWMTVAVIVPILVAFFLMAPAWAFAIFGAFISAFALYEYFKNFCKTNAPMDLGYCFAVIGSSLIFWAAAIGSFKLLFLVMWLMFFVYASRAMIRFNQGKAGYDLLAKEALSILYIPCLLSSVVLARCSEQGVTWLFFILFLAFISDTGAYYAGKTFGKHKLIPNLSPNKTVEGSIGSIFADLIVVSVFKLTLLPTIPWLVVPVLAASAAIATQLGDLFESMLKRSLDVKDSGTIFPGHGGMLDRIDGLLFTGPVVYLFLVTF